MKPGCLQAPAESRRIVWRAIAKPRERLLLQNSDFASKSQSSEQKGVVQGRNRKFRVTA
jgi:hypothetical protein